MSIRSHEKRCGAPKSQLSQLSVDRGNVIWLTGLSGSGKSTLARSLESTLSMRGMATYVLDGDILRQSLNKDLGFSDTDHAENVRRIGEVAGLLADAGLIVIVACIVPFACDRILLRELLDEYDYMEVFVDCPIDVCSQRDPRGLYDKAARGLVTQVTGLDATHEIPGSPDLHLRTHLISPEACLDALLESLALRTSLFQQVRMAQPVVGKREGLPEEHQN